MGVSPHLLYQTVHEGRACLLCGCPPLSFELESIPPLPSPSLHAVRWEHTLLEGSPRGVCGIMGSPPSFHAVRWERTLLRGCPLLFLLSRGAPLLPLGHAVRWERTLLYGGFPPFLWAQPARRRRARSVPCPISYLDWWVPLLLLGHTMLWECTLL